jgi:hypothetical protein
MKSRDKSVKRSAWMLWSWPAQLSCTHALVVFAA